MLTGGPARAVGVAGPVVFTLLWIVLGDASPGYSQRAETISALSAVGAPGRWIMLAGFALLAVSFAVTAAAGLASGRYGTAAPAFVGIAALGVLIAAVAPTSCSNPAWCRPVSASPVGGWHALGAGLMFAGLPLAMLAVAWSSRRGPRRRGSSRRAGGFDAWLAVVTFVVAVPLLLWFLSDPGSWRGFAEKAYVTVLLAWAAWLATRTGRLSDA